MKKWIFLIIVTIMALTWQMTTIYTNVQADKTNDVQQARQVVQEKYDYQIVEQERFHGNQLYYVFTLKDDEEKYYYSFVNQEGSEWQISFSEILLSKEEAVALVQKEHPDLAEVIRVVPAYSNDHFVWEVIANDQEGKLQYFYYSMEEKTLQKSYRLIN